MLSSFLGPPRCLQVLCCRPLHNERVWLPQNWPRGVHSAPPRSGIAGGHAGAVISSSFPGSSCWPFRLPLCPVTNPLPLRRRPLPRLLTFIALARPSEVSARPHVAFGYSCRGPFANRHIFLCCLPFLLFLDANSFFAPPPERFRENARSALGSNRTKPDTTSAARHPDLRDDAGDNG